MFANCKYGENVSDNSILPSPCSGILNMELLQKPQSITLTTITLIAASPRTAVFSCFPSMNKHRNGSSRITSQLMQESLTDKNITFWSVPLGKGISRNKNSYTVISLYSYLSYYHDLFKIH